MVALHVIVELRGESRGPRLFPRIIERQRQQEAAIWTGLEKRTSKPIGESAI